MEIAKNKKASREEMEAFVRERHHGILVTYRKDGSPQMSPVTMGMHDGKVVVSTYPERAKTANAKRNPQVSVCVLSDNFGGAWVQVDGTAEVLDMPEAEDGLVDYFRCISGEHPDWQEYRQAMHAQNKSLIRITINRWGPIAKGGFPSHLAS